MGSVLLHIPCELNINPNASSKVKEFSILLANRSAALYHMERYDHSIQDMELAEEDYPPEMMYKIKERTARCYLAKKSYEKALNAFK